jgi:hypothetical protein
VRVEDDQICFGEHDCSSIDGVVTPAVTPLTALVMAAALYIEGHCPRAEGAKSAQGPRGRSLAKRHAVGLPRHGQTTGRSST